MPSIQSDAFDVIPFEDIKGDWKKLGSGSFGNVYKGTYLGIDVAIKEVLPSNEYDVAKYFEREWRLMKESRHPNIVLFLGLSRAPQPDNRIFIISEFIENGNLRIYIHNKSKPFPWRMRISFATDIARALAYLHARRCIHRDLKGENLLVTANARLKITDFGFARIAARSADESKRLTFCGTDSYMSPEILLGEEFDLPTDIFSLGIIYCEILSRKLADDNTFKRSAPTFSIGEDEVREHASPGCPTDFLNLTLECLSPDPTKRPTTRDILNRLRIIEAEVHARPSEGEDIHVGSIKFMTGGKRPSAAPRIPSFGVGIGKDIRSSGESSPEDSDEELIEAVTRMSTIKLTSGWSDSTDGEQPLINSTESDYSTTVIKAHPSRQATNTTIPPSLSSILTIRASPNPNETPAPVLPGSDHTPPSSTSQLLQPDEVEEDPLGTSSILSIDSLDSYHSTVSHALATEGGSTIRSLIGNYTGPLVHRFTLIKPGAKPKKNSITGLVGLGLTPSNSSNGILESSPSSGGSSWNPFDLFFSSGLLVSKCDVCSKRLGWKPVLECDDCGLRAHVKCGEEAPMDCGLRPTRPGVHQQTQLQVVSPLSKVKQSAAVAASKSKGKVNGASPPR